MRNLFIADLKRMSRDILLKIGLIIGLGLSLFQAFLYFVIIKLAPDGVIESLGYDLFSITFSSFNPTSNFALILPIFIGIIAYKDFSFGTIRNKIIAGHKRLNIYLSLLISSTIIIILGLFGYALITFGLSSMIFGFPNDVNVWYVLSSFALEILICIFISSLVTFFIIVTRNIALCIVGYVGLGFVGQLVAIALQVLVATVGPNKEALANVLEFINYLNVYNLAGYIIGIGGSYEIKEVIASIITPILMSGLCFGLGVKLFSKSDLK